VPLWRLVNEGARILEEGYALRASDIDIIYLNGYGFPGCGDRSGPTVRRRHRRVHIGPRRDQAAGNP